ncbi:uncharacterized protein LOC135826503 isoform X2 [Sycon ciliatum]|uniref:uncharacterized protein LOC135826503 isoform X2 n=1 Tax=Sycon ciliatum TaxID=27933 RepID=UPI0031F6F64E
MEGWPMGHKAGRQVTGFFLLVLTACLHDTGAQVPCAIPRRKITFQSAGLEGFTQDPSDPLTWAVRQGPTPTANTGPPYDHTFMNSTGRYAYVEVTGAPTRSGTERSDLLSTFYGPPTGECNVTYWASLMGSHFGFLISALRPVPPGRIVNLELTVTEPTTETGDWLERNYAVTLDLAFRLRFGYTNLQVFTGDQGDLGIDDISFSPTCCDDTWFSCGGREWRYFPDFITWEEAQQDCVAAGGTLATVTTDEEKTCVTQLLPCGDDQCPQMFVGLNDRIQEGVFAWTGAGDRIEPSASQNWSPGQPASDASLDCVAWQQGSGLRTTQCNTNQAARLPYICQRGAVLTPQVSQCRNHLWQYQNYALSYDEAAAACQRNGSHLATIIDPIETECLAQLYNDNALGDLAALPVYVGCRSTGSEGGVQWSNTSSLCGEASSGVGSQCGVMAVSLGEENQFTIEFGACDRARPFICEKPHDECSENPCSVNAICTDTLTHHVCQCLAGYSGDGVECEDVDECMEGLHNCIDMNSVCQNSIGNFSCNCMTGYQRDAEDGPCVNINECLVGEAVCTMDRECVDTPGSFLCNCTSGTRDTGGVCEDVDECMEGLHNCTDMISVCQNSIGNFSCNCTTGYQRDTEGGPCVNINECLVGEAVCTMDRECVDTPGSFLCNCTSGTRDTGGVCEDVDECMEGLHNCIDSNSVCQNSIGNFSCNCTTGYRTDTGGGPCVNINECLTGEADCTMDRECVDTPGSFLCNCTSGTRDTGNVCEDIDECIEGLHNCHGNNSFCRNTPGNFTCECSSGYESNVNGQCNNINECLSDLHNCSQDRDCIDTQGAFTCPCRNGSAASSSPNITACVDIDECTDGLHTCPPTQLCINLQPFFECQCPPGAFINGSQCDTTFTVELPAEDAERINASRSVFIYELAVGRWSRLQVVADLQERLVVNPAMLTNSTVAIVIVDTAMENTSDTGLVRGSMARVVYNGQLEPRAVFDWINMALADRDSFLTLNRTDGVLAARLISQPPLVGDGFFAEYRLIGAADSPWIPVVQDMFPVEEESDYELRFGSSLILSDGRRRRRKRQVGIMPDITIPIPFVTDIPADPIIPTTTPLATTTMPLATAQAPSSEAATTTTTAAATTTTPQTPRIIVLTPAATTQAVQEEEATAAAAASSSDLAVIAGAGAAGLVCFLLAIMLIVAACRRRSRSKKAAYQISNAPLDFDQLSNPSVQSNQHLHSPQHAIPPAWDGSAGTHPNGDMAMYQMTEASTHQNLATSTFRKNQSRDRMQVNMQMSNGGRKPEVEYDAVATSSQDNIDSTYFTHLQGSQPRGQQQERQVAASPPSNVDSTYFTHLQNATPQSQARQQKQQEADTAEYADAVELGHAKPAVKEAEPVYDDAEKLHGLPKAKGIPNPFGNFSAYKVKEKLASPEKDSAPVSNPMYGEQQKSQPPLPPKPTGHVSSPIRDRSTSAGAVQSPIRDRSTSAGALQVSSSGKPPPIYDAVPPPVPPPPKNIPYGDDSSSTPQQKDDNGTTAAAVRPTATLPVFSATQQQSTPPAVQSTDLATMYALPYVQPPTNPQDVYNTLQGVLYPHLPRDHFIIGDLIGRGNFGEVHKATWIQGEDKELLVAIKSLKKNATEKEKGDFLKEAVIMGQFNHVNIVRLHGVVDADEEKPCLIVLELMQRELRKYLYAVDRKENNVVEKFLQFAIDISAGMSYLASKDFIHRDLATRNVMLTTNQVCKICDFGMSRTVADDDYHMSGGGLIPVKWTSPESIRYRTYSTESDVWSYGVVLYEIFSFGAKPYFRWSNDKVLEEVERGFRLPQPEICPNNVYQLQLECWDEDKHKRPKFPAIRTSLEDMLEQRKETGQQ